MMPTASGVMAALLLAADLAKRIGPKVLGTAKKVGPKAASAAKRAYASPHFLEAALGGTFLGSEVLNQLGQAGERGIMREQLEMQRLLGAAGGEATERLTKESRKAAEKYLAMLTKERREEAQRMREEALMESFIASQDRQLALALQAMQGISENYPATGTSPVRAGSAGPGMVGLMGSTF